MEAFRKQDFSLDALFSFNIFLSASVSLKYTSVCFFPVPIILIVFFLFFSPDFPSAFHRFPPLMLLFSLWYPLLLYKLLLRRTNWRYGSVLAIASFHSARW